MPPPFWLEGGFLTNPGEDREIADAVWRQKLAFAVASGVQSYDELANRRVPPKLVADYRAEQLPLNGTIVNPATLVANLLKPLVPAQAVSNPAPLVAPAPPAPPVPSGMPGGPSPH